MLKAISEEIYNKLDYAKSIASLNPEKAIIVSQEVYELAKLNNLELESGHALLSMAFASRAKSDISSILDYSYKALGIFKENNNVTGQIKALNLIGIAYFYASMYDESLECFFDGHDLLEMNNDDFLLSSILNNIGEIYRESEIYDKAIEYYRKAIDICINNNYYLNQAAILGNIGDIYFVKEEYKMALEAYKDGYDILVDGNDMANLGDIENKIGKTYFIIGDFDKAKDYYFKSYKRLEGINNKYYAIDVLINIAQFYLENSLDKTLYYYIKAMEYAEKIGSKKKLVVIYNLVSQYYEIQCDYKNAFEYYKKYSSLNLEIMSMNMRNKLEILNIEIDNIQETDKFDKLRIRLEKEISRQKNELEKTKLVNEILEKKVYEDELTGIQNRRSINAYLNKTLMEMSDNENMIVLYMIDIDKFKNYNDYWGHSEGDICIKKIADCIKDIQLNRGDTFGRYGGEEFVYISTVTTYDDALKLGNLIRTKAENIGLYYIYNGEKKATTISVGGVIGRSSDFSSMSEMLELADKELYKAKDMGRNITILRNLISV